MSRIVSAAGFELNMLHDPQRRLQKSLKQSQAKADNEHLSVSTLNKQVPQHPFRKGLRPCCVDDYYVLLLVILLVSLLLPLTLQQSEKLADCMLQSC